MSQTAVATGLDVSFKLNVRAMRLTDEQFARLCQENRDLRFELTAQQELVIMPPAGSETGQRNSTITHDLVAWARGDGSGLVFDSSTGFTLPNGAIRSPDASWVRSARWDALTPDQRERFAPLWPDFVVELRSRPDHLSDLRDKMQEYLANGARLGWLIRCLSGRAYP